ncbi:DUF4268 domain-containing protein [Candidatus Protochlamydia phocaeensis]|uniref:DUF4268 domain-containing protein n=1 Tax=Candidatus Protochlamydia phocaeensis TaxID=1414722 RepID=UPI000B33005A|nr:DUF4268 domain-containing protein [Candidatus Protochlamydia phocaeensis]
MSEAQDFTPWLAQEDNLALLGKTLDMELKLEVCEKDVGPFRADILCKDLNTDRWVLIENQLEATDHKHLGQVLTYASGLKALAIIWVAGHFTEEHRATLDWLNEITDERFHFFGLEIELWSIGESLPAPKFNLVAKPNNWSQQVASAANKLSFEDLTETRKIQLEYWQRLSHYLRDKDSIVRPQKAKPQHWINFAIGRSGMHLSASVNSQKKSIAVELYLRDINAKIFFNSLYNQKQDIEDELGHPLEWMELPEKTASRIILSTRSANFLKKEEWERQHEWLKHYLERFWHVFAHRVKNL